MAAYDPQVLKGILSMLLLQLLADEEDYGYSVVVRLTGLGFDGLAEGTVYPALSRLEGKGLLSSKLVASDQGPARKYYRPTPAGTCELRRATAEWMELRVDVDRAMSISESTLDLDDIPSSRNKEVSR